MSHRYKKVYVGGTFDPPLHDGHLSLLYTTCDSGDYILVALRSDEFLQKHPKSHHVNNFYVRRKAVSEVMDKIALGRYEIKPLNGEVYNDDMMKPECDGEAIVVSEETLRGAKKINDDRIKNNLRPFDIVVVPIAEAEDGKRISTTRIYKGDVDEKGRVLGHH